MKEFTSSDILTLTGSPLQRGRVHGETFRAKIQDLIFRWKEWLAPNIIGSPDFYIRDLVSQTNFIPAIQHWTPGLLEEIKGISEGSVVDFIDIFAFQLQDEEWWFGQEMKQGAKYPAHNCSSIGRQGSSTLVSQNMDMPDYLDGCQVILRIVDPQSEIEALVFSTAGLIALNGMNNHSIGVVCNNLGQLNHSRDGIPVAFIHRGVLQQKSFSDAKTFLESIPHASGQNYLLGGIGNMVDLECSANQVVAYPTSNGANLVCHTNHPFTNSDFRGTTPATKINDEELQVFFDSRDNNSRARFDIISQHLEELESEQSGPETVKKLLQSHESSIYPVCRHSKPGQPWMTLGTSIMDLTSDPVLHVCPGPPCSSTFTSLGFIR